MFYITGLGFVKLVLMVEVHPYPWIPFATTKKEAKEKRKHVKSDLITSYHNMILWILIQDSKRYYFSMIILHAR